MRGERGPEGRGVQRGKGSRVERGESGEGLEGRGERGEG